MGKCFHISNLSYLFVLLVLASPVQAKPKYKTDITYRPPEGIEGQACVSSCKDTMTSCGTQCATEFESCSVNVERDTDQNYTKQFSEYEIKAREHKRKSDNCLAIAQNLAESSAEVCMVDSGRFSRQGCFDNARREHQNNIEKCMEPDGPTKPYRGDIRARQLRNYGCRKDCGCDRNYDGCFRNCGGDILRQTVCVKDCDAADDQNLYEVETAPSEIAIIYIYREEKFSYSGNKPTLTIDGDDAFKIENGSIYLYRVKPDRLDLQMKGGFLGRQKPLSLDLSGGEVYFVELSMGRKVELRSVPGPLARAQMYELELKEEINGKLPASFKATASVNCNAAPQAFLSCTVQLPAINKAYREAYLATVVWGREASKRFAPTYAEEKVVRDRLTEVENEIAVLEKESKRNNRKLIKELRKQQKDISKPLAKLIKNSVKACQNIGKATSKELKNLSKTIVKAHKQTLKGINKPKNAESVPWQASLACDDIELPELPGCVAPLAKLSATYRTAADDLHKWSLRTATQVENLQVQSIQLEEDIVAANNKIEELTKANKRKNRKEIGKLKKENSSLKNRIKQSSKRHEALCDDLVDKFKDRALDFEQASKFVLSNAVRAMR